MSTSQEQRLWTSCFVVSSTSSHCSLACNLLSLLSNPIWLSLRRACRVIPLNITLDGTLQLLHQAAKPHNMIILTVHIRMYVHLIKMLLLGIPLPTSVWVLLAALAQYRISLQNQTPATISTLIISLVQQWRKEKKKRKKNNEIKQQFQCRVLYLGEQICTLDWNHQVTKMLQKYC